MYLFTDFSLGRCWAILFVSCCCIGALVSHAFGTILFYFIVQTYRISGKKHGCFAFYKLLLDQCVRLSCLCAWNESSLNSWVQDQFDTTADINNNNNNNNQNTHQLKKERFLICTRQNNNNNNNTNNNNGHLWCGACGRKNWI